MQAIERPTRQPRPALSLAATLMIMAAPAAAAGQQLQWLHPGQDVVFFTGLPINVVFVGYDEGVGAQSIDVPRFREGLANHAVPLVRQAGAIFDGTWTRLRSSGEVYELDYRITFASAAFTDALFEHLLVLGRERPLTPAQAAYNLELTRELEVQDPIAIDAVSVERWLAAQAGPLLGVDVRLPTVFFINWHGRADFRFHVYDHLGDADVDTGIDRGLDDRFTLMAWGGTAANDPVDGNGVVARVWFHDLSAGPDRSTSNFDLTNADVDGDRRPDYRLPPVWEYGSTNDYRPFLDLSGDLAKIVRFVATDMLFVPSPLYKPSISPPLLPRSINIDINNVRIPGQPPTPLSQPDLLHALQRLRPGATFSAAWRDVPFTGLIEKVNRCWISAFVPPYVGASCYGGRGGGTSFYDMFFYVFDHLGQLTTGVADHDVPVMLFELPDHLQVPIAGIASPDYRDFEYTQAHVLVYNNRRVREQFGSGSTWVLIHEVGHHLGLSHVHDGLDWDYQRNFIIDFGPIGEFHFARVGDQSSTSMSYLPLKNGFSQFQHDAMARWLAMANINQSNHIVASILASPLSPMVHPLLLSADADVLNGLIAWLATDYQAAESHTAAAYTKVLQAAAILNISVEPQSRAADDRARAAEAFFGDPTQPFFVRDQPPGQRPTRRLSGNFADAVPALQRLPAGAIGGGR